MTTQRIGFSEQIRQAVDLAKKSGLSQKKICEKAGIDQATLSRFMAVKGGLMPDKLDALADVLRLCVKPAPPPVSYKPRREIHVLSLCDLSGNWPKPWGKAGCKVTLVDIKHGKENDVVRYQLPKDPVDVLLCAPPCTDFAVTGSRYWTEKDSKGHTRESLTIVYACLRLVMMCKPKVWALENPVGRLPRYIGPHQMTFNPCDFGGYLPKYQKTDHPCIPRMDAYRKKTCLWGDFEKPAKKPVRPVKGSWINDNTADKEIRSITPMGFAIAFFEANKHRVGIFDYPLPSDGEELPF